jgi:hypothetical protein
MCYVKESRPPLWSSGQSSWLHNGDCTFCEVQTEFIYVIKKKVRSRNRDYGRRGSAARDTPLSAKVGTNFTDKRRSFGRYSSLVV